MKILDQIIDLASKKQGFNKSSTRSTLQTSKSDENDDETTMVDKKNEKKCGHVITTYVLPSIMHFIAYCLGFFYFRISENEQLYALMEKVFLAVNQTLKSTAQDKVIRRLK